MTIRVALNHQTSYSFDRAVKLWPHEIRLRPAAHSRTPILSYSLSIEPAGHFLNWQQDPFGNWVARLVFPEKAISLKITVDLVAEMTVINPFDFFMEEYAENFPFTYPDELKCELTPYLETDPAKPLLADWLTRARTELLGHQLRTIDMLVGINQRVKHDIGYVVRLETGVQTPEETLALKLGSCRDSAWLLVQVLRHLGLAARFASGYLIQLKADVKALDGPSGTEHDFTDLHAWTEVYIPGAGWIGLDPTSGLLAGEGHIPLACTAMPTSAAPVIGSTEGCEAHFDFSMQVTRIHEDPRVTQPYNEAQWQAVLDLGHQVDAELKKHDVRLTMGGEPTFVSIDDMDGAEWNYTALSEKKRELSGNLLTRLQDHFAPGSMLHFGQGKWYPGEPLPRWALGCYWRTDGKPLWKNRKLLHIADGEGKQQAQDALRFMQRLTQELGLDEGFVVPAFEDVVQIIDQEQRWPENFDPLKADLKKSDERRRIALMLESGIGEAVGYVLPLKAMPPSKGKGAGKAIAATGFRSSPWPLRREHLYLIAGDSPLGLRLPLDSLPWLAPDEKEEEFGRDPFDATADSPDATSAKKKPQAKAKPDDAEYDPREIIHTALCVEVRAGVLCVFLPPVPLLEDFVVLLQAIETTACTLNMPLRLEGYTPPSDARLQKFAITPDPGVIEVNIHPVGSWEQLVENTQILYEEARLARLGTEKFMLDGRHTGTGGGNHVTLGAATPADSPCLRRPDVLMSLITYWQHHPALSYLFSGMFIGPTSQAPRVDEARHESLYELEIAFQQMAEHLKPGEESMKPWLVDRLLRNLLIDLSGNTHRAEFCIDKLYSPDSATGRLGLVEFRGFEMPPHAQMSLLQMLLLRTLVARFWQTPYRGNLTRWGTELHDRYMLPHFVAQDMRDVVIDLQQVGYAFEFEWFAPFLEFRFPRYGTVVYQGIEIELRQAIEPWHVLGEEVAAGATARYVDSSVERMQVKVSRMNDNRHILTCNGRPVPLTATGIRGEYVAGVRYRAWCPPSGLHPTIDVQSPLVFDLVDSWSGRSIGGCTYHVVHPGGRNYDSFPVNANEAESRRVARFWNHGHTAGSMHVRREGRNPDYPLTLDLRRAPEPMMEGEPQLASLPTKKKRNRNK
ncbi:MAG: IMP dehydrogenase [Zetaproteobacteria bacterium CG12_big_fil_rev_8_21_14_0_65_55_1124]|nr:MAG: IMP dehydrogenase [Zetaproteobacteria bacterium CG1_02_55_237]PIS19181.1 MAG: IMP dehydrogenase [Zetaproteobacteria bacterium CG08_land_8_20_14_0_20_55_17]PIW43876.1 MAG: IMP dehydrogenase [Zetaproteobacteria bacterium CG12_big_fil_rev_8_21_14_0_65_55_1124]PIY53022.1 MAG: IMP dehydrogenase [Zetaproteobacteria bacterium CG_4_10_14_0_8_um_filter_55_43]PIZ37656.1 MAG: IMP dehydrogenase [Zetaproteobacteria bacterium CG_4_10_14_0_2_um_filter_55_20]PJB79707.1 MAG: IMP dehydrogenase [Zetaprot